MTMSQVNSAAPAAPAGDGRPATRYLLRLADVSLRDVASAGSKAATLGELTRAGFAVPDGFVLTTAAFERFVAENSFSADTPATTVAHGHIPDPITEAFRAAVEAQTPVAVRSSGTAEDLADASFAGQYVTVLDVRGPQAVLDAVRRCWASAFGDPVRTYRTVRGEHDMPAMAVLVQRMVPADAAGVAFTANPVTGDRSETIVSAVRGLGERLVSGEASPDEWVVTGGRAIQHSGTETALTSGQALAVADLARRVEARLGRPQDVEWAIAGGRLFLLQARPITTLPESPAPVAVDVPPGFWQREASHYPYPIAPMSRVLLPAFNASVRRAAADFGLLVDSIEFAEIGGWVYQRMVPLGGRDRRAPPAWLMPLLIRVVPSIRSRIRGAVAAVRADRSGTYLQTWYDQWRPELAAGIARLRDVDLMALSTEDLCRHVDEVMAFFRRSLDIHTRLNFAVLGALAEAAFACRDLLGWDDTHTTDLFAGLSGKSSEPARRLAELTHLAQARPAVQALLQHIDTDTVARLADADPEFAAAFTAYQHEYGCRALREITDPTLAESPGLVLGLVRDQLSRGYHPAADRAALRQRRATATAEAMARLDAAPEPERQRFEHTLRRAQQAYPLREDNQFYAVSAPTALLRYAALELGRRLADRGQLAARDDVFFLELPEVIDALRSGTDQRSLVARRHTERAWTLQHPGPVSYGRDPGPPPSFAAFPPEARLAMEGMLWAASRVFATDHHAPDTPAGHILTGIAASPGVYTGPVRVVLDETQFGKLRPGDVLVCPITSPVWSVLFPNVGALVTDTGGILSHSAIIAREYRAPAVVATATATRTLRDGQPVTVDGSAGTVTIAT